MLTAFYLLPTFGKSTDLWWVCSTRLPVNCTSQRPLGTSKVRGYVCEGSANKTSRVSTGKSDRPSRLELPRGSHFVAVDGESVGIYTSNYWVCCQFLRMKIRSITHSVNRHIFLSFFVLREIRGSTMEKDERSVVYILFTKLLKNKSVQEKIVDNWTITQISVL